MGRATQTHMTTCLFILITICLANPVVGRKKRQQDYNYKPSFTKQVLILERHENTKEGFLLEDISQYAKDDEGDKLHYSLDAAGQEICTIGQIDGLLRLKIRPDREQKDEYKFQVIVSDSFEGVDRNVFLQVYLYILDENDNKPIFRNTPYHVDVSEATRVGHEVITITASDRDKGMNSAIRYMFKNNKKYKEFELDPTFGTLKLTAPLDYEKKTSYTLEVVARDDGSPALSEENKVVINVLDVDDMKPYFVISQYSKEIHENIPIGSQVAILKAKDGDKGIDAEINYAIVAGDEYGLFHVDRKTGNVTVKGVLDREFYAQFTLQVEAYEADNVNSYTRINLNIKLIDENDNKPKFESDHYIFTLQEHELNPERIISREMRAYDDDVTWKNNFITYWMDVNDNFEVISESGTLIQKASLKNEVKDHFTFYVYATERETKERYTAKTRVDIHVNRKSVQRPVTNEMIGDIANQTSSSRRLSINNYLVTLGILLLCTLYCTRKLL